MKYITLAPEALARSVQFAQELEPLLITDREEIQDWAGKFHGCVLRIAGIFHVVEHTAMAANVPMIQNCLERAIIIGNYFLTHTQNVFKIMGADPVVHKAKFILKTL